MPYYIYKTQNSAGNVFRKLTKLEQHEIFREAKTRVRVLRAHAESKNFEFKIIFAESELEAEEMLQEKRETPVLMEWEK
ncbi:MAG: hypothetical protein ACI845_001189 [Gammaproteobacteria bacterium]|jgi:hypothetical protein